MKSDFEIKVMDAINRRLRFYEEKLNSFNSGVYGKPTLRKMVILLKDIKSEIGKADE